VGVPTTKPPIRVAPCTNESNAEAFFDDSAPSTTLSTRTRRSRTPVFLRPFAAGNVGYVASSDLLPEIKDEENVRRAAVYFLVFLSRVGLMLGGILLRGGQG
jgi:hypothetical protein